MIFDGRGSRRLRALPFAVESMMEVKQNLRRSRRPLRDLGIISRRLGVKSLLQWADEYKKFERPTGRRGKYFVTEERSIERQDREIGVGYTGAGNRIDGATNQN